MTFSVLPGYLWIIGMISVAYAIGALALLTVVVNFFATHHRIRINRHETVGRYYTHLATGH
ncbi:MAG TPA: hypothetical protein PKK40_02845 [Marmoricola sp.]|nr:hypothetical protein [Marmoricola sp.]